MQANEDRIHFSAGSNSNSYSSFTANPLPLSFPKTGFKQKGIFSSEYVVRFVHLQLPQINEFTVNLVRMRNRRMKKERMHCAIPDDVRVKESKDKRKTTTYVVC